MLVIFPIVVLAIFMGQPAGGNTVVHLCKIWSDTWFFAIGIRHRNIEIAPIDPGRHYVFVANHISYLDIPLIFKVIRKNMIRVLGKFEMSRIPIFGSFYRLAVIMVDRSSAERRAKSVAHLKKVLNHNTSILIFPEGTFNETGGPLKSFYDGAFRIAIETNTPIKPFVFLDAHKLLHYHSVFMLRPGISRAVVLPEVSTNGYTLDDVDKLKKEVYELMESTIIEYQNKHAGSK